MSALKVQPLHLSADWAVVIGLYRKKKRRLYSFKIKN